MTREFVVPLGRVPRSSVAGRALPWQSPLRLQQLAGNRAFGRLQAKLTINQPGDAYEVEADRVAEQVMRMPEPSVQRTCACGGSCDDCRDEEGPKIQRAVDTAPPVDASLHAPPHVASAVGSVVQSAGEPLDPATRGFMEPRLGADLSEVRIHRGGAAAETANSVRAQAYTLGRDIVFGAGHYAPHTHSGQRLLAHELVHVLQQAGHRGAILQRAEVDDRSCAGLTDIESDIDTKVNSDLTAARTAAGTPMDVPAFLRDVSSRIGGGPISPIEAFVEGLPASKRTVPPVSLAGTKYSGVEAVNRFYLLHTVGKVHVVGAAAKIHGICVGADKLGHFFEQGFTYFELTKVRGGSQAIAEAAGRRFEMQQQGLAMTGVYSNADLAANLAGLQFFRDLKKDPSGLTFKIKDYITSRWSEQVNPSLYSSAEGEVIWANLLGGSWQGSVTVKGNKSPQAFTATLSIAGGAVTGTYDWPAGGPKPTKGIIKNGKITQRMTAVTSKIPGMATVSETPVSGVSIEFDWEEGAATGKGKIVSVNEQTLRGTWGTGSSRTNRGSWDVKRI